MVVSQNPIRNGLTREAIEELIAAGTPEAQSALAAYWRTHKSAAAAHFVVNGFEKLQPSLVECRLTILRSFTVEPVLPLLRAAAFSGGIRLDVSVSDFNVYAQEILDPSSRLYAANPDVVILAVDDRQSCMSSETATPILDSFRTWIETFRANSRAHLIVHNLQTPTSPARGILDAQAENPVAEFNRELRTIAAAHPGVYVLDYDGLVARHGRVRWTDESKRISMALPIAPANLVHLAEEWMRFLHPITGRVAKALVVDLDNTLWSGILGEDGPNGIRMDQGYPGAIHRDVQRTLLDLRERGILLAIASKNDEGEAMEVLANHRDMLLRPEHFSAWRIGWQEKSQSLREIAAELNIGIEHLAFLDDNPVERERIASELPDVTVIDLPDEPIGFAQALRDCPALERLTLSEEDLQRTGYYADQRRREELERSSKTPEDFLRSLQQVVEVRPADPSTIGRIAQLTQKTNQFNVTTRRYSEQEIAAMAGRSDVGVYSMRVKDIYNDNGIVGVAILQYEEKACAIDTFLLSCRVIGRSVETAFLSVLSEEARARGAVAMKGAFVPSRKNAPAADFFARHGFNEGTLDLASQRIASPDWIHLA